MDVRSRRSLETEATVSIIADIINNYKKVNKKCIYC